MKNNRTTDDGVGGARGRMTPTQPSMFQPGYTGDAPKQVTAPDEFKKQFAGIVRFLQDFAEFNEKSICQEAIKGRSLSPIGLWTLCRIAARSSKPFILEQFIQQVVIQHIAAPPTLCVVTTGADETRAQARGDVDRWLFHVERTPVRRDQALDALGLHKAALATDMQALMQWDSGRRTFA